MLHVRDREIIRRDPVLPGLKFLLDPTAFVQVLRRALPTVKLGKAVATYVRYKPAINCLVGYKLNIEGASVDVYAKVHRLDEYNKFRKARQHHQVANARYPHLIILDDLGIVVWIFPKDDKLKTLYRIMNTRTRNKILLRCIPSWNEFLDGKVYRMRYKAERRFVGKLEGRNGYSVAIKVYTKAGYHSALTKAKVFASGEHLKIPELLGCSEHNAFLIFKWISALPLNDVLQSSETESKPLQRAGASLAELHMQTINELPFVSGQTETLAINELVTAIGIICPELRERLFLLARQLSEALIKKASVHVPIHGDFYANQVLLQNDTVYLLDFDRAVLGDPASDIGTFMAHLECNALFGKLNQGDVEKFQKALLDGYVSVYKQISPERIELYKSVGLLKLISEPFRLRDPEWPEKTEAILTRSEELIKTVFPPYRSISENDAPVVSNSGNTTISPIKTDVHVPFDIMKDPTMKFLASAVDPEKIRKYLKRILTYQSNCSLKLNLCAIRVVRHKPAKRCLIEYDVIIKRPGQPHEMITLIGKSRASNVDITTYQVHMFLWNSGFDISSKDGIFVPEPVGIIPELHMYLYKKVKGQAATQIFTEKDCIHLPKKIAALAKKIHHSVMPTHRRHSIFDELCILQEYLSMMDRLYPHLNKRLQRIMKNCRRLSAELSPPEWTTIHRDFYPDQIVVDGDRLYLIDLDLCCIGDPCLDIGNFLGHLTEQGLRMYNNQNAFLEQEQILEEEFLLLTRRNLQKNIQIYTILTLVRLIYISTQIPERNFTTEILLTLCEQRIEKWFSTHQSSKTQRLTVRR